MCHFITDLDNKTAAKLTMILASLAGKGVTILDLSGNSLDKKKGSELAAAFASIPMSVTSLDLSENELHNQHSDELAIAFTGIPPSVTFLDLSINGLRKKKAADLAIVFANLPVSITSLDLSVNNFYKKGIELASIFASIPMQITTLNLSGNRFNKLSLAEIKLLENSLPYLRTVYLSHDEVMHMSSEQRGAFSAILSQVENVILVDIKGNELGGTDLRAKANLARKLGFKTAVPSLLSQCTFFVRSNKVRDGILGKLIDNIEEAPIPDNLKELVKTF